MTGPGEAAAQRMEAALKVLDTLSEIELRGYRELIQVIAANEKYASVDEMIGMTAHGKLMAIDKALEKYQK